LYSGGNPTVANCSIVANGGAGFEMRVRKAGRFSYYNFPQIANSIIAANGEHGIFGDFPTITNCTIVGNLHGGIYDSRPTVANSIIYYNGDGPDAAQIVDSTGTVTYSNVQGSWPGTGNMDADPCFVDPDNGDYHLKSQAGRWDPNSKTWVQDDVSSPCIDAGEPDSCIGFEPHPNSSVINMGAYGGTAQASLSPSGVGCISPDHPDYDEWMEFGAPACWCHKRQCHGDADCKSQGTEEYWVSTNDLDILIAAWNKHFALIDRRTVNNVPLICADFDHKAQGKKSYRVSTNDLDILIHYWQVANGPAPDCP
jgi:hypothetical protein